MARILFLSDSHLGFDDPLRPRVQRRRRGPDFFDHYLQALRPAFDGIVDCVVHGGDLFYRSRIPDALVSRAFSPLLEIADAGIPILIVPGNHERGKIRQGLLEMHSGIVIFHKPSTYTMNIGGLQIAFSGMPFYRDDIRLNFLSRIEETRWKDAAADFRVLCMHHAVSGARVGVQDYTFHVGNDTINPHQIPADFNVVLCGHIHRHQLLQSDHAGNKLEVPVLFPGATTRTAFDERREPKGYCILRCQQVTGLCQWDYEFVELHSRPMYVLSETSGVKRSKSELRAILARELSGLPPDAVVKIRFKPPPGEFPALSSAEIRTLAPDTMSIEVSGYRRVKT